MPLSPYPTLKPVVQKLQAWAPLAERDQQAILALPHSVRTLNNYEHIVREGEQAKFSCVLLSGFAIRYKLAGDGGRQIVSVHIPGDFVDLQNSLLEVADHNVQAISRLIVASLPVDAVTAIAADRPEIGRALWRETLIEASIYRESIINIGRRNAPTRVAHLLCEMSLRLNAAGLAAPDRFDLPLTQEQLGDLLGLTAVHVNRVLRNLASDGIIGRAQRTIIIRDKKILEAAGDFDSAYLHLSRAVPTDLSERVVTQAATMTV